MDKDSRRNLIFTMAIGVLVVCVAFGFQTCCEKISFPKEGVEYSCSICHSKNVRIFSERLRGMTYDRDVTRRVYFCDECKKEYPIQLIEINGQPLRQQRFNNLEFWLDN